MSKDKYKIPGVILTQSCHCGAVFTVGGVPSEISMALQSMWIEKHIAGHMEQAEIMFQKQQALDNIKSAIAGYSPEDMNENGRIWVMSLMQELNQLRLV